MTCKINPASIDSLLGIKGAASSSWFSIRRGHTVLCMGLFIDWVSGIAQCLTCVEHFRFLSRQKYEFKIRVGSGVKISMFD